MVLEKPVNVRNSYHDIFYPSTVQMLSKNSDENVYGEVVDFKLMLQLLVLEFMIPLIFLETFSNMKKLTFFTIERLMISLHFYENTIG